MNERRESKEKIIYLVDKLIETAMSLSLWEHEEPVPLEQGVSIVYELIETLIPELTGNEQYLLQVIQQLVTQKLPEQQILNSFGNFSDMLYELIERGVNEYELKNPVQEAVVAEELPEEEVVLEEEVVPVESPPPALEAVGEDVEAAEFGEEEPGLIEGEGAPEALEAPETVSDIIPAGEPEMSPKLEPEHELKEMELLPDNPFLLALSMIYPRSEILTDYLLNKTTLQYYLPEEQLAIEVCGAGEPRQLKKEHNCESKGIKLIYLEPEEFINPRRLARTLRRWRVG